MSMVDPGLGEPPRIPCPKYEPKSTTLTSTPRTGQCVVCQPTLNCSAVVRGFQHGLATCLLSGAALFTFASLHATSDYIIALAHSQELKGVDWVQGIPALMPPGAAMPAMGGMPMAPILGAGIDGHPAVAGGAVTGATAAAVAAAAATAASTPAMLLDDHGGGDGEAQRGQTTPSSSALATHGIRPCAAYGRVEVLMPCGA